MKLINKLVIFITLISANYANCKLSLDSLKKLDVFNLREKVKDMSEIVLNYTVYNKTIKLQSIDDFNNIKEKVIKLNLLPGSSIKIICNSNKVDGNQEDIFLYPSNLKHTSVSPMYRYNMDQLVDKIFQNDRNIGVINNFNLFRSDSTIIYKNKLMGNNHMFQYPKDAVIVSDDEFTINFLCIYHNKNDQTDTGTGEESPNNSDDNGDSVEQKNLGNRMYKWIEISVKNILPLSYGCGGGRSELFKNLMYLTGVDWERNWHALNDNSPFTGSREPKRTTNRCSIRGKDGMYVGIYCGPDEVLDDEHCLKDPSLNLFFDVKDDYLNRSSKLFIYKIRFNHLDDNHYDLNHEGENRFNFVCKCKDKRTNLVTAEMSISLGNDYVLDVNELYKIYLVHHEDFIDHRPDRGNSNMKKFPEGHVSRLYMKSYKFQLRVGNKMKMILPKNFQKFLFFTDEYMIISEPYDLSEQTGYIESLQNKEIIITKLMNIIITNCLSVNKIESDYKSDTVTYVVDYNPIHNSDTDSNTNNKSDNQDVDQCILINKTQNMSINYYVTLTKQKLMERRFIKFPHLSLYGSRKSTDNIIEHILGIINIDIFPTDPYINGCDIYGNKYFKNPATTNGVGYSNDSDNERSPSDSLENTNLKINVCNVNLNDGPVGFYCPRPNKMVPNNCFESVLVNRGKGVEDQEVELRSISKNLRFYKTKNFQILELISNNHNFMNHTAESDSDQPQNGHNYDMDENIETIQELVCKCVDEDNNTLSVIKVQVPTGGPNLNHQIETMIH